MDLEELEDIKADIKEVFEEEAFDVVYSELDRSDSNVNDKLGIIKTPRRVNTTIKAAYVFRFSSKRLDEDTAEFIPQKGGTIYLSTSLVDEAGLTIKRQIGEFIIEDSRYEVRAVQLLPEILGTSVVHKITLEAVKTLEGTE